MQQATAVRDEVASSGGDASSPEGRAATDPDHDGIRVRLFDADRTDRLLSFDEAIATKPSARQLMWLDVSGDVSEERRRAIRDRFDLDRATETALAEREAEGPHVAIHGQYFHIRLVAEPDPRHREASWLDIVAGPNVVISRHTQPLALLDALDERIAADATIGQLDAPEFVASLLDAVVTTYLAAVDAIEDDVDVIDAKALARESFDDLFGQLVTIRRRIGRLRRLLARHRELFAVLGRRDFAEGSSAADPEGFQAVAARFEAALTSVEETRDVILGSFEVLMTRTSQKTNDVMRVLTVVTVLALPATLTSGFLGMNVVTPFPGDQPWAFWVIALLVLVVEVAILLVARQKRWL
jgi:magnesium transporter